MPTATKEQSKKPPMTDPAAFETAVRAGLAYRLGRENSINDQLHLSLVSCDASVPSVEFVHEVTAWDLNVAGNLHGGIISTLMDSTMGLLSKAYTGARFTPTISLTVNFLHGVKAGESLHVRAEMTHAGGRILQLNASCWTDDPTKPAATAMGTFYRRPE